MGVATSKLTKMKYHLQHEKYISPTFSGSIRSFLINQLYEMELLHRIKQSAVIGKLQNQAEQSSLYPIMIKMLN
jgi:hypothetical protein